MFLTSVLLAEIAVQDLVSSPNYEALCFIGNGHAKRLLKKPINESQLYWTRFWAARSLFYLGDDDASEWLIKAFNDEHWRVRMMAVQSLGRFGIDGREDDIVPLLVDEHKRVRTAAAIALGRIGNEFALEPLHNAYDDSVAEVRIKVDRAIAKVEKRIRQEET